MSNYSSKQTTKRDAILTAAGEQFNQYGFKKRPWRILRSDSVSLEHRFTLISLIRTTSSAAYQWPSTNEHCGELSSICFPKRPMTTRTQEEERVTRALMARHSPFQKAVSQSTHGGELFDEYSRLCGDIVRESHDRFQSMLGKALNQAAREGSIHLKARRANWETSGRITELGCCWVKTRRVRCADLSKTPPIAGQRLF